MLASCWDGGQLVGTVAECFSNCLSRYKATKGKKLLEPEDGIKSQSGLPIWLICEGGKVAPMMKRSCVAMIFLLAIGGCKSASVPTPMMEKSVVQKVEDGGIAEADLNHADAAGMQLWFGKHQEVAQSVASQCKAAMKDDLAWKTSVEGRICLGDKFDGYGMGR